MVEFQDIFWLRIRFIADIWLSSQIVRAHWLEEAKDKDEMEYSGLQNVVSLIDSVTSSSNGQNVFNNHRSEIQVSSDTFLPFEIEADDNQQKTIDDDKDNLHTGPKSDDEDECGVDGNGGALQKGEQAHPWSLDYFGVYYQYWSVGMLYGISSSILYPIFNVLLAQESYQVKAAGQVRLFKHVFAHHFLACAVFRLYFE
jgi:hypothetical protein